MKILVPGGAGYIGSYLVPFLLADGHEVTVLDTMWFGHGFLPKDNENCTVVNGDVRDIDIVEECLRDQDAVLYLASISNNEQCERNPEEAKAVNVDALYPFLEASRDYGVQLFVYASSVAAYGSSNELLKEDAPLVPTTLYSRHKAECEMMVRDFQRGDFTTVITRSASVCGYSSNMRFDLTVNRMVHDAITKGLITVNGGPQVRSHIHISDVVDFYRLLLDAPEELIAGETWNIVCGNEPVIETAMLVARTLKNPPRVDIKPRSDDRSYAVDGSKAREFLNFVPKKRPEMAIRDMEGRFEQGLWKDSGKPEYWNLR